jgi:hypothetical protein
MQKIRSDENVEDWVADDWVGTYIAGSLDPWLLTPEGELPLDNLFLISVLTLLNREVFFTKGIVTSSLSNTNPNNRSLNLNIYVYKNLLCGIRRLSNTFT